MSQPQNKAFAVYAPNVRKGIPVGLILQSIEEATAAYDDILEADSTLASGVMGMDAQRIALGRCARN